MFLRTPDVASLAKEPHNHVAELEVLLMLLMGCSKTLMDQVEIMDLNMRVALCEQIKKKMLTPWIIDEDSSFYENIRRICHERSRLRAKVELSDRDLTMHLEDDESDCSASFEKIMLPDEELAAQFPVELVELIKENEKLSKTRTFFSEFSKKL